MSATNDLEKQREEFAQTLSTIKRSMEDNNREIADLRKAVAAGEEQQRAMRQTIDALNRERVESSTGTASELRAYQVENLRGVDAPDQGRYLRTDRGIVQLTGHNVRHELPGGHGESVEEWRWGLLDDPAPKSKAQLELQRAVTRRSIVRALGRRAANFSPAADRLVRLAALDCGGAIERIFSDSSAIGAEWIPDQTLPELQRKILVPTNATAILRRREIPPGGTVHIPMLTNDIRIYKHAVPSSNNPADATLSDLTTSERTIDTVPGVASTQADRDALSDSIIPYADRILELIAEAYRFAEDDTLFNGDTAAAHQDTIATWDNRGRLGGTTGLGTTADHRRRWLGLRARGVDLEALQSRGATDQGAAQTWAGLQAALANLGADNLASSYMGGSGSGVLVWTSWEYFFGKMLGWAEFASWEKVGALASILTGRLGEAAGPGGMLPGQVGFVQGFIPVCIGYPLSADLATSGLFTGSGATTGMVQCDTSRFEYCWRSGLTTESVVNPLNNTVTWVTRFRTLVRALDPVAATVFDTHYSYNLTY